MMRRAGILIGILLSFSVAVRAQGPAGTGGNGGGYPGQHSVGPGEYQPWQVSIGYQYSRVNLLGTPFNMNGGNISVERYFVRWFAVEINLSAGFGNTRQTTTPPNLTAKLLYGGVGPRFAYRNRTRFEPWAHVLVGVEHFRFSQSSGFLGTNNAVAGPAGGGLDIFMTPHVGLRLEADAVGSHFFSTNQRSFQAISAVVIDF